MKMSLILHENGRAGEKHFNKKSFALKLVLTQRQTRTRSELGYFICVSYKTDIRQDGIIVLLCWHNSLISL